MSEIKVVANILKVNEEVNAENKKRLDAKGIFTVNLMSSPGSGKTSILEQLIVKLQGKARLAVIEGDLYTSKDAERIGVHGIPVVQINTGGGCHLDARMVRNAMDHLELDDIDILVIENVGNLVCPAGFDLGEDLKITVLSITEGNDKPQKYPRMFEKSKAVVLNKMDLLDFTNFSKQEFYKDVGSINPDIRYFETSCMNGQGIEELCFWLQEQAANKKAGSV